MTRKDELAQLALNYLHQHHKTKHGLPINCDVKCLTELLQQVEREVLDRVIVGYRRYKESLVPKPGCEKFPMPLIQTFEEWLRAQQQELG